MKQPLRRRPRPTTVHRQNGRAQRLPQKPTMSCSPRISSQVDQTRVTEFFARVRLSMGWKALVDEVLGDLIEEGPSQMTINEKRMAQRRTLRFTPSHNIGTRKSVISKSNNQGNPRSNHRKTLKLN